MQSLSRSERTGGWAMLLVAAAVVLQIGTGTLVTYVLLLCAVLLWIVALVDRPDSAAVLDRAIEIVPAGICVFAPDLRVVASNEQFASIHGLTRADVEPGTPLRRIVETRKAGQDAPDGDIDAIGEAGVVRTSRSIL